MTDEQMRDAPATDPGWGRRLRHVVPRWAVVGLFIYASVFLLSYAQTLLVPIVFGILLALIFSPIRRFFSRRGVPSPVTAMGIMMLLFIGLFVLMGALALPVTNWIERAPQIMYDVRAQLREISGALDAVFEANERIQSLMNSSDADVQTVQLDDSNPALSMAMLVPGMLAQIVFTFVLLFFLLATGDMFHQKIVHVLPTFKDKRKAMEAAFDIERKLSRYLLTITIINAGLGVVIGCLMWLFGMPGAPVFGLIGFLFNFVPYVGAVGGIIIAAAVALVSFDWVWWSPIIAACYFMATFVEGQFVTPTFVGKSLRLNTVVVFVSVSFWAWTWSFIGMIVAIPVLVAVRTLCNYVDSLQGLGEFLSDKKEYGASEPVDEVEERVSA
ncbi:Predicted PurR-regulated permease PerM [Tranquillimonas rosea]|uniref:Predicted PurR-regulated permease PerM n=1 Tax=Tranquillimonas rosea TaxID=641238 RepID=A0A1H9WNY9_9RHOB|nr:AI-2E family transporter [Tranquillimonas rosea]SES35620.1 Predicted PurR-regulated permease PerM [Tranquillimonas rosea]